MSDPKRTLHVERLENYLDELPRLRAKGINSRAAEFESWQEGVHHSLSEVCGPEADYTKRFDRLEFRVARVHSGEPQWAPIDQQRLEADLSKAEVLLRDALEEIDATRNSGPAISPVRVTADPKKIFVVHGHDVESREVVARYLEHLQLKPVVLHEQVNAGRTLIEKFEQHADVSFAVVLLTPDDVGAPSGDPSQLQYRARQNVILELGYFVGKLGRNKVCALHRGPLELPSDIVGVLYVPFDDGGGWKLALARELKHGGLSVDLNRAV